MIAVIKGHYGITVPKSGTPQVNRKTCPFTIKLANYDLKKGVLRENGGDISSG
jgi:hypothetical protein